MAKRKNSCFRFKPFSVKQKKAINWWMPGSPYVDHDGIVADGSIRSGKTIAFILGFILWSTKTFTGENFIISGKSIGALKRNVVTPMLRILQALKIKCNYNRSENFLEFGGNTYYLFGANNEASQDVLQGITAAGWLADEVALQPQSFIEQAFGRCSVEGSKYWLNCNPENPQHFVKVDLIDQAKTKHLLHIHFDLDDNLTLSPRIKERYKRMFSGVWFKRYILGLWVAAEGAIYDLLDEEVHVVPDAKLPRMLKHWVGCDYGTGSVTTFWLLGLGADQRLYFVDFWRWDVVVKQRQISDPEIAQELDNWLELLKVTPEAIIIPQDALSFAAHLRKVKDRLRRIKSLRWADRSPGSVVTGIRDVYTLLSLRKLLFSETVKCKGGLGEWQGYIWDPKAQERGEDSPVKRDDHNVDASRYVLIYIKSTWSKWLK